MTLIYLVMENYHKVLEKSSKSHEKLEICMNPERVSHSSSESDDLQRSMIQCQASET